MSKRIEIGFVCEKGKGHFEFHGDPDAGGCGSHSVASIFIEIPDELENNEEVLAAVEDGREAFIEHLKKEADLRAKEARREFEELEAQRNRNRY